MAVVPYTNLANVRQYLSNQTSNDDDLLKLLINVATAQIERRCKRKFIQQPADETRLFTRNDITNLIGNRINRFSVPTMEGLVYLGGTEALLNIHDDLASVTTLTNGDGTVLDSSKYWLYPYNKNPKWAIQLKSSYSWNFSVDQPIQVTGQFVYSLTPPEDIVQATNRLVAYHYRNRDSQVFDVTADPNSGQLIIPKGFPADVDRILKDGAYVRAIRIY